MSDERNPANLPDPTVTGSTAEAIRRVRRKRRWRVFFKIAAVIVILLVAFLIYAQTSMALRQLWLPLAGKQLGTRIAADSGDISYRGKLRLNNFRIMGTDNEPAFQADRIALDIAPLSLFSSEPHIRRVAATNPAIRVRVTRDGGSNWDFPGLKKSEPKQKEKPGPGAPKIQIDELYVQNLAFDMRKSDQLMVSVKAPQLTVKNFAPGRQADFEVAVQGKLERPHEKITQSGTINAGGTITQSADGRRMDWDTRLRSSFSGNAPGLEGEQKVDVQASSKGNYDLDGLVTQTFVLRAISPSGPAGSIDGDVKWDIKQNARHVKLEISNVGREALNPILATIAPLQMKRGKINGTTTIEGTGELVAFNTDLSADGMSFEIEDRNQTTSLLNMRLRQSGEVNIKTNELTWRQAEFTLGRENKRLIQAVLDKPLTMTMGGAAGKTADAGPALLRVTIDAIEAKNLRPWLMLVDVPPASQPTEGTINGEFTLGISRQGAQLRAQGRLSGNGLRQAALGPNPTGLRNDFDIAFADFNNLDIQKMTVDVTSTRGSVAQAALTGRMRIKEQEGSINVEVTAPRALEAASHFGLLAKPPEGVTDGRLQLLQDVKLDFKGGKTTAKGTLSLSGISIANAKGQSSTITLNGENRLTIDAKRSRVEIDSARIHVDYGAGKPGLIELTGNWQQPQAAKTGGGEMHITASGLNLTPWLLVSGMISGRNAPPIPFEASEQIVADGTGRVRVKGDMRVGIDPGMTGKAQMKEFTLLINHDIVQAGAQIEKALLDLATQTGGGATDRVRIDATGELGDAPRIELAAHAERLDINPYLAWIDRLTTPSLNAPARQADAGKPAQAVIDAKLTVDELKYRDSKLIRAQGAYRYENGAWTINVTQGLLNDGPLKGEFGIDNTRSNPRYAWNVSLEKANAQRVLELFNPSMGDRITGELTLNSRCTAEGSGESFKRTLQGQNTFTVINGGLHGVFLLDILARQTLVDSFSNLKFFDFSGRIDLANNTGKLKDVKITGPEHRVDIEGQFDMDGNYDLTLIPAIATGVAQKISTNKWLPSLVQSIPGFMQFPFKVVVKGGPKGNTVLPVPRLPVNVGNVAGAVGDVVGGAAGAVGGAVEKIPGGKAVTRPIKELNKLNPFAGDKETTATQEQPQEEPRKEGIIDKIPGSGVVRKLNPFSKDKDTTR